MSSAVGWEFVRSEVERGGLDRVEVLASDRRGRIAYAEGVEMVAALLDRLPAQVSGSVYVDAWPASGKRSDGFRWYVSGASVGAAPVDVSAGPGSSLVLLEKLYDTRLELERERMDRERDDEGGIGRLADVIDKWAPHVLGALVGRRGGAAPARSAAEPVAGAAAGGLSEDETRAMLADVVAFARMNPDAARAYAVQLRQMMPEDEKGNSPED